MPNAPWRCVTVKLVLAQTLRLDYANCTFRKVRQYFLGDNCGIFTSKRMLFRYTRSTMEQ